MYRKQIRGTDVRSRRHAIFGRGLSIAAVVATVTATAACGNGSADNASAAQPTGQTSAGAAAGSNADLAALVPDSYRKKGFIDVASEAYPTAVIVPPNGGTPTGWEPDTAAALGKLLNIDFKITIIPFAGVIPGLQAKRFDVAMGAIGITPERRKVATFVTENNATLALLAKANTDIKVSGEMDLCGKSVAVLVGSTQVPAVQAAQQDCKSAGKPAPTMVTYQTQNDANLAVQSGRTQLVIGGTGTLNYVTQQAPGQFKLFPIDGAWTQPHLTGIAIPDTPEGLQLAKALAAGMNELIKNGTYEKIYKQWNSGQGMIEHSEVLAAQP